MPRIAPEKVAAGARLSVGRLAIPDQSRYGTTPAYDGDGVAYRQEGGGTTATCGTCGWIRWEEHHQDAERAGAAHTCKGRTN